MSLPNVLLKSYTKKAKGSFRRPGSLSNGKFFIGVYKTHNEYIWPKKSKVKGRSAFKVQILKLQSKQEKQFSLRAFLLEFSGLPIDFQTFCCSS